jgi:hypothetical protein
VLQPGSPAPGPDDQLVVADGLSFLPEAEVLDDAPLRAEAELAGRLAALMEP